MTMNPSTVGLPRRRLGPSGPTVGAIGLGCMAMTGFYGHADEAQAVRTLRRAIESGCDLLDTSDAYGPHTNELLLSRVLGADRDRVFVATKFGVTVDPVTMRRCVDGSPENARRSCDASLRRLGVDRIDLYYPHRVDPAVPIEETVGALGELVRAGKVRCIGLSEPGPRTIRRAHAEFPLTAVQTEYSLWSRDAEQDVLPVVRELGLGLVAYAPLGRGGLAGRVRDRADLEEVDLRRSLPRFAEQNLAQNVRLADRLAELASARDTTSARLALAWVLHQGDDVIPIAGTTRVSHLEENLTAAHLHLDPADLAAITEAAGRPAGERYDPVGMQTVGI
jgi:aryl-alcohol dehydrogenase-like predicted oxidoreductase